MSESWGTGLHPPVSGGSVVFVVTDCSVVLVDMNGEVVSVMAVVEAVTEVDVTKTGVWFCSYVALSGVTKLPVGNEVDVSETWDAEVCEKSKVEENASDTVALISELVVTESSRIDLDDPEDIDAGGEEVDTS